MVVFHRPSTPCPRMKAQARLKAMIGTWLTLGFVAVALFALAVLGNSLARGLATAGRLRGELAACEGVRFVTVRSASTSAGLLSRARITPERALRRTAPRTLPPLRQASRVAA